ncbi:hypothetical protein CTheo_7369 [Ceratobasidium theobromae]|uniref:F-box domain-containing protein n=1 Tax=Ceratobasidium theobromae TaxID=1582974 RepID=A0A5N5QC00_9AGAM|nr:hypothetical protein CTheo_7369 [Ceratobasidium theobromae]
MSKLAGLPSEIYTVILSHVPPGDRQTTVLNLTRALPRSPVPRNQIYDHIIVHTPPAVWHLYKLFRKQKGDEGDTYNPSNQVKSISIQVWMADADLVVNLLALLPDVPIMRIFVGTTYSPEHLQDIFTRPRLALRTLNLRFKPYVERATYLPFLKGAYFDSTIVQLTKWPVTEDKHLKYLSIAQDTISYETHVKFAQPLVSAAFPRKFYTLRFPKAFFSLEPLAKLATSPVGQYIQALRVSVPAKPVTTHLGSQADSFPRLKILDISTTTLPPPNAERAIGRLLGQLNLHHIIIDRSAGPMPRDSPAWAALGRACALAKVEKAKQKEREIQEWVDMKRREEEVAIAQANQAEQAPAVQPAPNVPVPTSRARRRGRRGLATSTISLRDSQPQFISLQNTPNSSSSSSGPITRRIRIVPSPPTLRTFSTAFVGPSNPTAQQRSDWGRAFVQGFLDGCGSLNAIWKRMQDSATVRVMRFIDNDTESYQPENEDTPTIFHGVADIAVAGHWIGWEPVEPIICFGTERAASGSDKNASDDHLMSEALSQIRIGSEPGTTLPTEIASQDETPSAMGGTRFNAISDVAPSSVGGLWANEAFIEWGAGHAERCGHNIGKRIFG